MRHTFFCIDGHTAGNPVRLIAGGAPILEGGAWVSGSHPTKHTGGNPSATMNIHQRLGNPADTN